uniref:Eukaryotic translation initiation factor 5A n=1 Tax=Lygus hesperus TaxID=30085 RepID=A0A146KM40_LYGHE
MSDIKAVPRQPMQAGSCKKGSFVVLKGRPCKVVEVKTSKTGKHGHAKANITGVCVLSQQKCVEVHPTSHNITEFKLEKTEYLVCDVDQNESKINVLDDSNNMKFFIYKPDSQVVTDLIKAMEEDPEKQFTVTVIRAPVETTSEQY